LRRFERLSAAAGIVKLSRSDADWLYPGRSTSEVAVHLMSAGASCVVVTDGAAGAAAWNETAAVVTGAPHVDVVDTVGAGDAFTAGLLAALWRAECLDRHDLRALDEGELRSALTYGAAAGAAQCESASARGPTCDDVNRVLQAVVGG
jgi:fructokinase